MVIFLQVLKLFGINLMNMISSMSANFTFLDSLIKIKNKINQEFCNDFVDVYSSSSEVNSEEKLVSSSLYLSIVIGKKRK